MPLLRCVGPIHESELRLPLEEVPRVKLLLLMSLLLFGMSLVSGCLFNGGSASLRTGAVNNALLCSGEPQADGCPPCSAPEGPRCRDQWYTSALRCMSDAQCGASGACQQGFCVGRDVDGDGIDDDLEREVADLNFPKVLMAQDEGCGTPHGVIYRVRRHPDNLKRLAITYVVLYANDCGELNGHTGDAESFSITVDLDAQPGAAATVGVQAWAHSGTTCGSTSSCQTTPATNACGEPASVASPQEVVIYASQNKHANYLSTDTCSGNCLDSCSAGERINGPLLNVGEPNHPMVTDLTSQGFVQPADGWDQQLLHFNPWGPTEFAGGGSLAKPLTGDLAPPGP